MDKARRNDEGFRVSAAIQEKEVIAQIFLVVQAMETCSTGSGICGDDAITNAPIFHPGGDFRNAAGEFVSKNGGRHDHAGVMPAFVNLEIGAASERGFDGDANLAGLQGRRGNFLDPDVLASVEHSGFH